MKRREFIALVGGAAVWPAVARGQQTGKSAWIGCLSPLSDTTEGPMLAGLRHGLSELGWVEGRNLTFELRFAEGRLDRLSQLASELVDLKVDVIVTGSTSGALAAKNATSTIPIVIVTTGDPVRDGLVESLARPGGNITGLSNLSTDLSPKTVELLRAIVPGAVRIGVLSNPQNPSNAAILDKLRGAMALDGMTGITAVAAGAERIEAAFANMVAERAQAVVLAPDTLFVEQRRQIAELALERRLPTMCEFREHVEAGALMSYGQNLADGYRRTATFVDRIFKGGKPGELPIEQATKLELVINLATARALGLAIPTDLLVRADEMIE